MTFLLILAVSAPAYGSAVDAPTAEEITRAAAVVLADDKYRADQSARWWFSDPWRRALGRAGRFLSETPAAFWAAAALFAAVLAALVWRVARLWRQAAAARSAAAEAARRRAEGEDPRAIESAAAAAAQRGEYAEALRGLLLALRAAARESGAYAGGESDTWRDFAACAAGPSRARVDRLVAMVERCWYGGQPATAESFTEAGRLCAGVTWQAAV